MTNLRSLRRMTQSWSPPFVFSGLSYLFGGISLLMLISCAAPSSNSSTTPSPLDTVQITGAEPVQMLPVSSSLLETAPSQIIMNVVDVVNPDTVGLSIETKLVHETGAPVDLGTISLFPSTSTGSFRLPFDAPLNTLAEASDGPIAPGTVSFRFELIPLNQPELFNESVSVRVHVSEARSSDDL